MGLNTILTNTILIPTGGNLGQIPSLDVAEKLGSGDYKLDWNKNSVYDAYIKLNDGAAEKLIAVEEIRNFNMKRNNSQQQMVGGDYVVNLPGTVTYENISIKHAYTRDAFFLKWLTDGALQGGSPRADIEIHIHPNNGNEFVFTCYDAFPVGWSLDSLSVGNEPAILYETVEMTFSYVGFRWGSSSNG